jgi:hypothetical protein
VAPAAAVFATQDAVNFRTTSGAQCWCRLQPASATNRTPPAATRERVGARMARGPLSHHCIAVNDRRGAVSPGRALLAVHRWKSLSNLPPSGLGRCTLPSPGGEPPQGGATRNQDAALGRESGAPPPFRRPRRTSRCVALRSRPAARRSCRGRRDDSAPTSCDAGALGQMVAPTSTPKACSSYSRQRPPRTRRRQRLCSGG